MSEEIRNILITIVLGVLMAAVVILLTGCDMPDPIRGPMYNVPVT